jgi:hypothetical protein
MEKIAVMLLLLGVILAPFCRADGLSPPVVLTCPQKISQGDLGLIRIRAGEGETLRVMWQKQPVPLHTGRNTREYVGILSVDLRATPGIYKARVQIADFPEIHVVKIGVLEKDYGIRNLTLPGHMVDLDIRTLERVRKESQTVKALWTGHHSEKRWHGAFLKPLEGPVIGPFGRKSIINKKPRSPHSGVDIRAGKGSPVKATNAGRVVLSAEHFFSGKSVFIDHGGGIQSMYFHLDRIHVEMGESVTKGQVLGLVGSTGRATGPHLHFGIRVNGARVDPMRLIEISRHMD